MLKIRVKIDDLDFVCFSPEKFIDIKDNKIYTYPMKGTIDTNLDDAKNLLLNSKKELAEHTMVVDLLRNDLGKVAKNIKVEEFRTFSKITSKNALPSCVRVMRRVVRTRSLTPRCSSSASRRRPMMAGATPSALAAAVRLPLVATETNDSKAFNLSINSTQMCKK